MSDKKDAVLVVTMPPEKLARLMFDFGNCESMSMARRKVAQGAFGPADIERALIRQRLHLVSVA